MQEDPVALQQHLHRERARAVKVEGWPGTSAIQIGGRDP